jgi:death-on-curing protein
MKLLTAEAVVRINKKLCLAEGNPVHCYDIGKVESALFTAFYPGSYPFQHGVVAKLAGAVCFYICQAHAFEDGNKRTAAIAAETFAKYNGLTFVFPETVKPHGNTALAQLILNIADEKVKTSKEETIAWFDQHKQISP